MFLSTCVKCRFLCKHNSRRLNRNRSEDSSREASAPKGSLDAFFRSIAPGQWQWEEKSDDSL